MLRKSEGRKWLEHDTEGYFYGLTAEAAREEDALAESLHAAAEGTVRRAIDPDAPYEME